MNEARPRTGRERSFEQDVHPRRSDYGSGDRDQEDHPVASFLRRKFLKIAIATLVVTLSLFPQWIFAGSEDKAGHLFFIERSKNKNLVQYDVRLAENRVLPDSMPVNVYWILENGKREELNSIEKKYAYGIVRQVKLAEDKFKIIVAAFESLEIIVERMNNSFKAVVSINGKESILQKIYIKSEENSIGLPKVLYIDFLGRIKETGLPIKVRIVPGR